MQPCLKPMPSLFAPDMQVYDKASLASSVLSTVNVFAKKKKEEVGGLGPGLLGLHLMPAASSCDGRKQAWCLEGPDPVVQQSSYREGSQLVAILLTVPTAPNGPTTTSAGPGQGAGQASDPGEGRGAQRQAQGHVDAVGEWGDFLAIVLGLRRWWGLS